MKTTKSGATAVQIVRKFHGKRTVLAHLRSAHTDEEVAALMAAGRSKIDTQALLDLGLDYESVLVEMIRKVVGSRSQFRGSSGLRV